MAQQRIEVPMLDMADEVDELWDELQEAIQRVLRSGRFIMGPDVRAFEEEAAKYLGVRHTIAVNSCTDALVIALRAMGIGPGDEVITTPFTFFATAEAVSQVGATPVFVDIDPETFNIDPRLIEDKINERTKAILPVHLYGQAAEMDEIMAIAVKYNLKVLEDVAQAMGAEYKGRKLGTIGNAGAFSFFPSKPLGAYGDGGMIATNDDEIAEISRMLRMHGAKKKYYNEVLGYNSRLDTLQAAILRVKLPHLDRWIELRRRGAAAYGDALCGVPGITLPIERPERKHVYHQYTIRVAAGRRDEVQRKLAECGVQTMVYYPVPVHLLPVYRSVNGRLPVAEKAASEVLSLPIWPQMGTEEIDFVARSIRSVIR